MDFSLMFFSQLSNDDVASQYKMMTNITCLGDDYGFKAVWLPERHFNSMGGIYPDPAVLASALAVQTKQIRLRPGSVVLPLHHPAQVVESWACVDNLSNGRVDLGFASGWNKDDFVLAPEIYPKLRQTWFERVSQVRSLWRGDTVSFTNGELEQTEILTYPRPVQEDVDIWLAISKQTETFRVAGQMGCNVLTMLAGSSLEQLAERIAIYRQARQEAGFDPNTGVVSLMMHTFIHWDEDYVHNIVRGPFLDYIKNSVRSHLKGGAVDLGHQASEREVEQLAEYSFERYYNNAALFGSVIHVQKMVDRAKAAGVNDIACLLDFGIDTEVVIKSMPYLRDLKDSNEG